MNIYKYKYMNIYINIIYNMYTLYVTIYMLLYIFTREYIQIIYVSDLQDHLL